MSDGASTALRRSPNACLRPCITTSWLVDVFSHLFSAALAELLLHLTPST
jgi:hypothetical protein